MTKEIHIQKEGLAHPALIRHSGGIDIVRGPEAYRGTEGFGRAYEDAALANAASRLRPGQVALGAGLMDYAMQHAGYKAPPFDIAVFEVTPNSSALIRVEEAKRQRHLNCADKLRRISLLLAEFRENPDLLPNILLDALGEQIIPAPLFVPSDGNIWVRFRRSRDQKRKQFHVRGVALNASIDPFPIPKAA